MDQSYLQSFLDGRSMWDVWVGVLVLACVAISIVLLRQTHKPKLFGGKDTNNSNLPTTMFAHNDVQNFSPHFPTTVRGCPNCHEYMVVIGGQERCTNVNCKFGLKKK